MNVVPLHFKKPRQAIKYLETKVALNGKKLVAIVGFGENKKPAWYGADGKLYEDWRKAKQFESVEKALEMRDFLRKSMKITFINPITPLVRYDNLLYTLFNLRLAQMGIES